MFLRFLNCVMNPLLFLSERVSNNFFQIPLLHELPEKEMWYPALKQLKTGNKYDKMKTIVCKICNNVRFIAFLYKICRKTWRKILILLRFNVILQQKFCMKRNLFRNIYS